MKKIIRKSNTARVFAAAAFVSTVAATPLLAQTLTFDLDADGDGISDAADKHPCNSTITSEQSGTFGTYFFEDLFPVEGDYDLNDAVVGYKEAYLLDSNNRMIGMRIVVDMKAVGATLRSGLAARLPIAFNNIASITRTTEGIGTTTPELDSDGQNTVVRLLDDTRDPFDGLSGFINTDDGLPERVARSVTIDIQLNGSIDPIPAMRDVFLVVNKDKGLEVHLPQFSPTSLMRPNILRSGDDCSDRQCGAVDNRGRFFVSQRGSPFALFVPDDVPWALEGEEATRLFPQLLVFAATGGQQGNDFFVSNRRNVSFAFPSARLGVGGGPLPNAIEILASDLNCVVEYDPQCIDTYKNFLGGIGAATYEQPINLVASPIDNALYTSINNFCPDNTTPVCNNTQIAQYSNLAQGVFLDGAFSGGQGDPYLVGVQDFCNNTPVIDDTCIDQYLLLKGSVGRGANLPAFIDFCSQNLDECVPAYFSYQSAAGAFAFDNFLDVCNSTPPEDTTSDGTPTGETTTLQTCVEQYAVYAQAAGVGSGEAAAAGIFLTLSQFCDGFDPTPTPPGGVDDTPTTPINPTCVIDYSSFLDGKRAASANNTVPPGTKNLVQFCQEGGDPVTPPVGPDPACSASYFDVEQYAASQGMFFTSWGDFGYSVEQVCTEGLTNVCDSQAADVKDMLQNIFAYDQCGDGSGLPENNP